MPSSLSLLQPLDQGGCGGCCFAGQPVASTAIARRPGVSDTLKSLKATAPQRLLSWPVSLAWAGTPCTGRIISERGASCEALLPGALAPPLGGVPGAGAWPYALPYPGLDPTVAAMAASAAGAAAAAANVGDPKTGHSAAEAQARANMPGAQLDSA